MSEELSVVIPIYNVDKYLKRCLDSILSQTIQLAEIICVNDGSTDESLDILKEYAKLHKNIKIISKENGGLVSARKAGLEAVSQKYVTYVDSDDFIEPEMYQCLMDKMHESNADIVTSGLVRDYGSYEIVDNEKIPPGYYSGDKLYINVLPNLIDRDSFYHSNVSVHVTNKIYRTDILREIQNKVENRIIVGEDAAVVYPYLLRAKSVYVSGENFYHYCIRNDSIMGTKKEDDSQRLHVMLQYIKSEFDKVNEIKKIGLNEQYRMFYTYMMLLREAENIIEYDGTILYPFGRICKNARILLYGAGKFGIELKDYLDEHGFDVSAWMDKAPSRQGVVALNQINEIDFDVVIIAVLGAESIKKIRSELETYGIDKGAIISVNANMIINM